MNQKLNLPTIAICLLLTNCSAPKKTSAFINTVNEIEVGKTEMKNAIALTGTSDDEFDVYACGKSSGHVSGWSTYKKLGLALYTVSYSPERQDGYKNGIVRNIGIFDTTHLNVRRSEQQRVYDGQDYYPISKEKLTSIFGKADKIKTIDTLQLLCYSKSRIIFCFNKKTEQFIKLYIMSKS